MKKILYFSLIFLLSLQISCTKKAGTSTDDPTNPPTADEKTSLVLLYTNDEHGWLEADDTFGGAAGLYNMWETKEGYNGADSFLIVSGGDMWTGPAISTWFQGESMVEVMNAMEYDASTIGNHEFDFKVEGLENNKQRLDFPMLASNIRNKSNGEIPSFASPYKIINSSGVKVAIIGLSSVNTPSLTLPVAVKDYDFIPYEDAIVEYVPVVKDLGAEIIIIVGHIGETEMTNLAPVASSLGVSVITGGHTHRYVSKMVNGVFLIEVGSNMKSYGKVVIEYNKTAKQTKILSAETVTNPPNTVNNKIQTIVNKWKSKVEEDLNIVIGYCSDQINSNSPEMHNMITDSWLEAYPQAQIAMTNDGGIRQNIITGEITLSTIIGVLPFTNTIYEIELTGTQVIDCIGNLIVGGMTTLGGYTLLDGSPIEANTVYSVLTTDYLYTQPNSKFAQYDPEPYNTSILYMQPTVDWILSKNTTIQNPINNYLDYTARK
jgi:5'-nucleotidase / UDP-sugar diphosphatase